MFIYGEKTNDNKADKNDKDFFCCFKTFLQLQINSCLNRKKFNQSRIKFPCYDTFVKYSFNYYIFALVCFSFLHINNFMSITVEKLGLLIKKKFVFNCFFSVTSSHAFLIHLHSARGMSYFPITSDIQCFHKFLTLFLRNLLISNTLRSVRNICQFC